MKFGSVVSIVKGFKEHTCPNETFFITTNSITSAKIVGTQISGSATEGFIITKLIRGDGEAPNINESTLKSLMHRTVWDSRKSVSAERATSLQAEISARLPDYTVHVVTYKNPLNNPFYRLLSPISVRFRRHESEGQDGNTREESRYFSDGTASTRQSSRDTRPPEGQLNSAEQPNQQQTVEMERSGLFYVSDTGKGLTLFDERAFGDSVLILLT